MKVDFSKGGYSNSKIAYIFFAENSYLPFIVFFNLQFVPLEKTHSLRSREDWFIIMLVFNY